MTQQYHGLPSWERNWCCRLCGTFNAPDYERCQECRADTDGNLPDPAAAVRKMLAHARFA